MEQALAQRNPGVSLKPGKSRAALTITHPNAAGIDIGSGSHFVAAPPGRDDEAGREVARLPAGPNGPAGRLKACGINTVPVASARGASVPGVELLASRGATG